MATTLEELKVVVEQLSIRHQRRVLEFAYELAQLQQEIVRLERKIAQLQQQKITQREPASTSRLPMSLPTTKLPPGRPGSALLRFTLPPEDIEAMEEALEDCERIDPDEY
jgi:phage shock protein A